MIEKYNAVCPAAGCKDSRYYRKEGSKVWIDILLCPECSKTNKANPESRDQAKQAKNNRNFSEQARKRESYLKRRDPFRFDGPGPKLT